MARIGRAKPENLRKFGVFPSLRLLQLNLKGRCMTQTEQMALAVKGIGETLEDVLVLLDADDVPASREQIECLLC
jgi:hypothetical protein